MIYPVREMPVIRIPRGCKDDLKEAVEAVIQLVKNRCILAGEKQKIRAYWLKIQRMPMLDNSYRALYCGIFQLLKRVVPESLETATIPVPTHKTFKQNRARGASIAREARSALAAEQARTALRNSKQPQPRRRPIIKPLDLSKVHYINCRNSVHSLL